MQRINTSSAELWKWLIWFLGNLPVIDWTQRMHARPESLCRPLLEEYSVGAALLHVFCSSVVFYFILSSSANNIQLQLSINSFGERSIQQTSSCALADSSSVWGENQWDEKRARRSLPEGLDASTHARFWLSPLDLGRYPILKGFEMLIRAFIHGAGTYVQSFHLRLNTWLRFTVIIRTQANLSVFNCFIQVNGGSVRRGC